MDRSLGFSIVASADTSKAEAKIGAFARSVRRYLDLEVLNIPYIDIDSVLSQARTRCV